MNECTSISLHRISICVADSSDAFTIDESIPGLMQVCATEGASVYVLRI